MDTGLKGKVAIVTAASRGLGFASAMGLAREGCDLAICSRDEAAITEAAAAIAQATGQQVLAMPADLSSPTDIDQFLRATFARYGGVDILVSNTGGPPPGLFMDFDDAAWQGAFDALLMPAVRLSRAVIPAMRERGGGRILYVTSGAVKQPIPNLVLSNSLRAAVTGMMKTLSAQVGPWGITVNCVAPGRVATDRVESLDQLAAQQSGKTVAEIEADWAKRIPAGRYGDPEEFGATVVFLASRAASYITGSTIMVDGGLINTLL